MIFSSSRRARGLPCAAGGERGMVSCGTFTREVTKCCARRRTSRGAVPRVAARTCASLRVRRERTSSVRLLVSDQLLRDSANAAVSGRPSSGIAFIPDGKLIADDSRWNFRARDLGCGNANAPFRTGTRTVPVRAGFRAGLFLASSPAVRTARRYVSTPRPLHPDTPRPVRRGRGPLKNSPFKTWGAATH